MWGGALEEGKKERGRVECSNTTEHLEILEPQNKAVKGVIMWMLELINIVQNLIGKLEKRERSFYTDSIRGKREKNKTILNEKVNKLAVETKQLLFLAPRLAQPFLLLSLQDFRPSENLIEEKNACNTDIYPKKYEGKRKKLKYVRQHLWLSSREEK